MKGLNLIAILFFALISEAMAEIDYDDKVTRLRFDEVARMEVQEDRYKATLRYQSDESSEKDLIQKQVNRKMKWALDVAQDQAYLKVHTGHYSVNRVWNRKNKNLWRAAQTIILDSANKEALLEVVGKLQKNGFSTNGLNAYLSVEKRDSYKNQLISQALKRIKKSAKLVAKDMDRDEVRFLEININPQFPHARPMPFHHADIASLRAEAAFDKPVVKGSGKEISVKISALVLLKD